MPNENDKFTKRYKFGSLNSLETEIDVNADENALNKLRRIISDSGKSSKADVQTWTGFVLKVLEHADNEDHSKTQKAHLRVPGTIGRVMQFIVRIPEIHAAIPEPASVSTDPKKPLYDDTYVMMHDVFTLLDTSGKIPGVGDQVECDFRNRKNFTEGVILNVYHKPNSFTGGLINSIGAAFGGLASLMKNSTSYGEGRDVDVSVYKDKQIKQKDLKKTNDPLLKAIRRSLVPTAQRISSMPSKNRKDPVEGLRSKPHAGIDIAVNAKTGQYIKSPKGGKVERAKWNKFNGNHVIVDHGDGYRSYFLHLQDPPQLKVGQTIPAGYIIGIVGNSGRSAGIHLHYGIKRGRREWVFNIGDVLLKEWKV